MGNIATRVGARCASNLARSRAGGPWWWRGGRLSCTATLVVSVLAFADAAAGATVSADSASVSIQAAAGEANEVEAVIDGGSYGSWTMTIVDAAGGLIVGAGCTSVSATEASCSGYEFFESLHVELGDNDDNLVATQVYCPGLFFTLGHCLVADGGGGDDHLVGTRDTDRMEGGDGHDFLEGGSGLPECVPREGCFNVEELSGGPGDDLVKGGHDPDSLRGGPGNDVLQGGSDPDGLDGGEGNDTLDGDAGWDWLDGGGGADSLSGGLGRDGVSYDRTSPIRVTIDGIANDGESGEGDNVHTDVEAVQGGEGDDTLIGNGRSNFLDGYFGNDRLFGEGGNDSLSGFFGADLLVGGPGDDVLDLGRGHDRSRGNAGADRFLAADGKRDIANGGVGRDRATIDSRDYVASIEAIRAQGALSLQVATGSAHRFTERARL